jgi:hypothetical protein
MLKKDFETHIKYSDVKQGINLLRALELVLPKNEIINYLNLNKYGKSSKIHKFS